jgi:hypothetical protein
MKIIDLFYRQPLKPYSIKLDLSGCNEEDLLSFLRNFVMIGCDILFKKELASLNVDEIDKLRKYLQSIGYDAEYDTTKESKVVKYYNYDGTPMLRKITSGRNNITFKIADRTLI